MTWRSKRKRRWIIEGYEKKLLHGKLDLREHCASRKENFHISDDGNCKSSATAAELLDCKEKEKITRPYKLNDTRHSIGDDFSKERIAIRLWEEVRKLWRDGKYTILKHDEIFSTELCHERWNTAKYYILNMKTYASKWTTISKMNLNL